VEKASSIYVAGHTGLIGSAVLRLLKKMGFKNIIVAPHDQLELIDSIAVEQFFRKYSPQYVVLAAGRVGGILENSMYPAEMITSNLSIQLNVLRAAFHAGVRKTIFFGSSCMYPRDSVQPMPEAALLNGVPEQSSLSYAVAKLAGVQMCLAFNQQLGEQRFIPIIPNSVYGPNDNFDLTSAHVLAALLRRIHEAHQAGLDRVTLWGTGKPRREFIHADDVARACLVLLSHGKSELHLPLNFGLGVDYSIGELSEIISEIVGFKGQIEWDHSKPEGASRKLLDCRRAREELGWSASVPLFDGLVSTYSWFKLNK